MPRISFVVFAVVTQLMLFAIFPARADSVLEINYQVSFWDVPIGRTDYEATFGGGAYSVKGHFETGGVIGLFWKSVVDATVKGSIVTQSVSPTTYESNSQNRDRPLQQVKISFQDGIPFVVANPPYDTKRYPVNDAQKRNAVDALSALTSIFTGMKTDDRHPCGTSEQVFDGRRRYDVSLTYVNDETVKLDDGVFNNVAHLCEIHYTAIAGYPPRDVMSWQTSPKMFADVVELGVPGSPSGRYIVPVKLWSTRTFGTMTITLNKISVDGAPPPGMVIKPS